MRLNRDWRVRLGVVAVRSGALVLALVALAACMGPDYRAVANRLREENIQQKRELDDLRDKLAARDVIIGDLQQQLSGGAPPLQTLPPQRLEEVFTAARMEIRSQTNAEDLGNGQQGFRVFIRTFTNDLQIVPAAGLLTIEAFELPAAPAEPRRLGAWTFTAQEMKKNWYTGLGLNHFAFSCPVQTPPILREIVFKARLRDALTGNLLEAHFTRQITPWNVP